MDITREYIEAEIKSLSISKATTLQQQAHAEAQVEMMKNAVQQVDGAIAAYQTMLRRLAEPATQPAAPKPASKKAAAEPAAKKKEA